jgi:hypothetical protein
MTNEMKEMKSNINRWCDRSNYNINGEGYEREEEADNDLEGLKQDNRSTKTTEKLGKGRQENSLFVLSPMCWRESHRNTMKWMGESNNQEQPKRYSGEDCSDQQQCDTKIDTLNLQIKEEYLKNKEMRANQYIIDKDCIQLFIFSISVP